MPHQLRQQLFSLLQEFPAVSHFWIAYSGGLDSTVLVHLVASLRNTLAAEVSVLHVDHGLSEHSREWSSQCRRFCEQLGLPIRVEEVTVRDRKQKGLEAAAREARYGVFERLLGEGEVLLTAHHRDDQAETLLLQLLRGGGVHGLAAMPERRPLGRGSLLRPLLAVPRGRLKEYAEAQRLDWIEDPSNFDHSLERNYLRHTLLPQLAERRQGIRSVLSRSAGHFAESARLLDELAAMDRQPALDSDNRLAISVLRTLSPERCRNLLRYHLRKLGLPVPQHKPLQRILDEVMVAAEDAMPLVSWSGGEVRRYRDHLYFLAPLPPLPSSPLLCLWQGEASIQLPAGMGAVHVEQVSGRGVSKARLEGRQCELRQRQGGERLQPSGRHEHHQLKKLYQEAALPPWDRERRPLLFVDGVLVQVAGLWTAQEYAAKADEAGIILHWSLSAIENTAQNDDN